MLYRFSIFFCYYISFSGCVIIFFYSRSFNPFQSLIRQFLFLLTYISYLILSQNQEENYLIFLQKDGTKLKFHITMYALQILSLHSFIRIKVPNGYCFQSFFSDPSSVTGYVYLLIYKVLIDSFLFYILNMNLS